MGLATLLIGCSISPQEKEGCFRPECAGGGGGCGDFLADEVPEQPEERESCVPKCVIKKNKALVDTLCNLTPALAS